MLPALVLEDAGRFSRPEGVPRGRGTERIYGDSCNGEERHPCTGRNYAPTEDFALPQKQLLVLAQRTPAFSTFLPFR